MSVVSDSFTLTGEGTVNVAVTSNALGTPLTFQVKITTTGTAVQGPNLAAVNGVVIVPHPNNAAISTTGGVVGSTSGLTNATDGTGAGSITPTSFACSNANELWFNGIAGDIFFGSVS